MLSPELQDSLASLTTGKLIRKELGTKLIRVTLHPLHCNQTDTIKVDFPLFLHKKVISNAWLLCVAETCCKRKKKTTITYYFLLRSLFRVINLIFITGYNNKRNDEENKKNSSPHYFFYLNCCVWC